MGSRRTADAAGRRHADDRVSNNAASADTGNHCPHAHSLPSPSFPPAPRNPASRAKLRSTWPGKDWPCLPWLSSAWLKWACTARPHPSSSSVGSHWISSVWRGVAWIAAASLSLCLPWLSWPPPRVGLAQLYLARLGSATRGRGRSSFSCSCSISLA